MAWLHQLEAFSREIRTSLNSEPLSSSLPQDLPSQLLVSEQQALTYAHRVPAGSQSFLPDCLLCTLWAYLASHTIANTIPNNACTYYNHNILLVLLLWLNPIKYNPSQPSSSSHSPSDLNSSI